MLKRFFLHFSILFFFAKAHAHFFIEASGLYWQANQEGLGYAVKSLPKSKVENLDFDWDFGFRLGLGYRMGHDDWGCLLRYTTFQTHTNHDAHVSGDEVLYPLWLIPSTEIPFADSAHAHWRLHLGLGDLLLDKSFEVSKGFSLKPEIGVRGGSVRQKYYVEYSGRTFSSDEIVHMKNKYFGVGPIGSLMAQWKFGKGWSVFGRGGFSLLLGEFYIHQDEYAGKEKLLGLHDEFWSTAAILELAAGIRWQPLKRLQLALGWDQSIFFSQNQMVHFTDVSAQGVFVGNQGDLSVSGLELEMRFVF